VIRTVRIDIASSFKQILLLFILLVFDHAKAQDTIVKRNNDVMISKVNEIGPDEIKYRLFSYPDGPVFTSKKWELKRITLANGYTERCDTIKAPSVTLGAGSPRTDNSIITSGHSYIFRNNKIYEADMLEIAKNLNDKKLNAIINRTHELRFIRKSLSAAAMVAGSFGFLTYVGVIPINSPSTSSINGSTRSGARQIRSANTTYRHTLGGYFMLGGLGCEAISLVVKLNEVKHAHLVVKVYNEILQKQR
jgi:hypothetical protein